MSKQFSCRQKTGYKGFLWRKKSIFMILWKKINYNEKEMNLNGLFWYEKFKYDPFKENLGFENGIYNWLNSSIFLTLKIKNNRLLSM